VFVPEIRDGFRYSKLGVVLIVALVLFQQAEDSLPLGYGWETAKDANFEATNAQGGDHLQLVRFTGRGFLRHGPYDL